MHFANLPIPARRHARAAQCSAALLALTGAMLGCQAQPTPRPGGEAAEAALMSRIQAEVGEARCSRADQCAVLPIGAKACGGPASWLAYATQPGRADKLQAWSGELATLQRRRQEATGMVSNCAIEPEPAAACQAGRCVLKPSAMLAR